jgi:fumarylacetoacetate (FAA) hydrolase family protein
MTYFFFNSSKDTSTRKADLDVLDQALHSNDPKIREDARESLGKIRNESGKVRSMRERLIKEHRRGNIDNIKDIHDYINKHNGYR